MAPTPNQVAQWTAEGWRYYVPSAGVLTTTKREAERYAKGSKIYALVKPGKARVRHASRKTDRFDEDPGVCGQCGDPMHYCQCDFGWNTHYEGWGKDHQYEGEAARKRRQRRDKAGNPIAPDWWWDAWKVIDKEADKLVKIKRATGNRSAQALKQKAKVEKLERAAYARRERLLAEKGNKNPQRGNKRGRAAPSASRRRRNPKRVPVGDCFAWASKRVGERDIDWSDPDINVVHATVAPKWHDRPYEHAWVEMHGKAFDWQTHSTKPEGLSIKDFYDHYQPIKATIQRYSPEEAVLYPMPAHAGHYGPWTDTPRPKGRIKRRNPADQVDLFAGFAQKPRKARKASKASTKASKPPKTAPARSQAPQPGVLCDPGPLIKERTSAGPISDAALPDHSIAETTWKVVDLSKLLWSNQWNNGETITAYPKVYQPRDRRRPSYRDQHRDIVKYFNPEILMWAATAQQGAPIVVDDPKLSKKLIVASGNGRTMALAEIYLRTKPGSKTAPVWPGKQKAYRDELNRWSSLLGITIPANIKHPVLVRVLDSSVDGPHFARLANETLIAELNATEQAIKDANKMSFAVADKYVPFTAKTDKETGIVTYKPVNMGGPKNKPFVEAFIRTVAGEGARNELMTVTPQGKPKLSDTGIQRIEYALFRFAYGSAVDDVLIYLTEQEVPTASSLLRGLMWSAAYWIAFEREVREGRMEERYDLRKSLVTAVLRAMRSKENFGLTPIEAAWSHDLYAGDVESDNIEVYWMRAFYRAIPGKISNTSLADVCREYCAEAIAISSPAALASTQNFDLFGVVGEVKERAAAAATLPPSEFLARSIATALFNEPFAPRFTKTGKVVRDVETKLMPTSLADVARSAGETLWEICQFWDTQWQGWLIDWATAVKGSKRRLTFKAARKEAWRWFQIGVRPNQRQDNIKAFDRHIKGNAVYAAADKAWKASLK